MEDVEHCERLFEAGCHGSKLGKFAGAWTLCFEARVVTNGSILSTLTQISCMHSQMLFPHANVDYSRTSYNSILHNSRGPRTYVWEYVYSSS